MQRQRCDAGGPVAAYGSKLRLPERGGKAARHMSHKIIPNESGVLRGCPKVAQQLSKSCPTSRTFAKCW